MWLRPASIRSTMTNGIYEGRTVANDGLWG
jgi:hypothetical protein